VHAMKAHEEMESELHSFLTSVLNGGQFSASRPLNRTLCGPPDTVGHFRDGKSLLIVPVV
jgi:hypothetical protein